MDMRKPKTPIWLDRPRRVLDAMRVEVRQDNIVLVAAGVAFYAVLAVIPALVIAVSLYGLFTDLDEEYVDRVEDVVRIGDEVMVKVTEIDDRGRVNLSRRLAMNPDAPERPKRPPRDRGGRGDDRRGGGRGDRGDSRGGGGGDRRGGGRGGPRRGGY